MVVDQEQKRVNSPEEIEFGNKLVLFNNKICPFGARAWWSLEEADAKYDYVHIELGDTKPKWYAEEINPSGTVPTIYDDANPIFESDICAEFVEDKFHGAVQLVPKDPLEKANMRLVIKTFGEKVIPFLYKLLINRDESKDEDIVKKLGEGLEKVENLFAAQPTAHSSPYFGSDFSLAEIMMVPFLDRFSQTLPFWRSFEPFPKEKFPLLVKSFDECKKRRAFQATTQDPTFYQQGYTSYAIEKRNVMCKL